MSLKRVRFDPERHLELLHEADDADEHLHSYLDRGELFEIRESDEMIGVTVLVREGEDVEISNIALAEEARGRGLGRSAIEAIAQRCRGDGNVSRLTVGTSDCSLGTIAFYRKAGFRFDGVRKDYFDHYPVEVIENGIRARDMVMFEMDLTAEVPDR
ncbi:MAG: GNAT family N-acetyltransferase [Actinomycetota bacterium]|nr:GNAT family N-acetyltransferase [Actinomycetota bacterium]